MCVCMYLHGKIVSYSGHWFLKFENGPITIYICSEWIMYCLINEQVCFIRFKA
jgi:hypothetical protein